MTENDESPDARFAMIRTAVLAVEEAVALVDGDREPDPVTRMAVDLAWGSPMDGSSRPEERPQATTARYHARMGGRATPFGLLAGTAHAVIDRERRLAVEHRAAHTVLVRPDFEALEAVVTEALAEADPERIPVRRNRTVRTHAGRLRYTKAGDARADVVMMRSTPAVTAVLDTVGDTSMLVEDLLDGLERAFPGAGRAALADLVATLLEHDVLQRSVDLISPGAEPVELAAGLLDRIGDHRRSAALQKLAGDLAGEHLVEPGLAARLESVWESAVDRLPVLSGTPANRRYHLDLAVSTSEAAVDERTVTGLLDALRRIEELAGEPSYLSGFRESFRARYEDAEVPLLTALDPESGVMRVSGREMSALAQSLGIRSPGTRAEAHVDRAALEVLGRWRSGTGTVDIADLPCRERSSGRGVFAALLDGASGYDSMLVAGYQRTPVALVGRFAQGRPDRVDQIARWYRAEADGACGTEDGPIRAELVYSPANRFANVLLRPRLYRDEIALDGGGDGTIALDRLLVRVVGDSVRLRDSRSGRDVVVEMNTPHNVTAEALDPIYSFLGMLVSPGAIGWSWGGLATLGHLPRVTSGRVVVAPEQWNPTGAEIRRALESSAPGDRLRELLDGVGERRWIGVGDDDRLLPVDLTSPASVRAGLSRSARAQGRVRLLEVPHVEHPAATGPTGRHVTEIVVPFAHTAGRRPGRAVPAALHDPESGTDWVYAKLYCGPAAADAVIARAQRAARELVACGSVRDWFFLRFRDDGFHVRVRLRPVSPGRRADVLAATDALGADLRRDGLVTRVVLDTYVPEVARYGGARCLPLAESLFTADSDAVATFVATVPDERTRLFRSVADLTHWCAAAFDDHDEQHDYVKRCLSGLEMEFPATGNPHGRFYREHRAEMAELVGSTDLDPAVGERLTAYTEALRAEVDRRAYRSSVSSVIHMHCNRLFGADGRRLEFLAYEMTGRLIRERKARGVRLA